VQQRPLLWIAALALVAACGVILISRAREFLPFMADDSFISLRYSDRLLEGKGLTWDDYERVEGYSNLLWVVGVAVVSKLGGGDLIAAARLLGMLGMLATVAAVLFGARPLTWRKLPAIAGGGLLLACSAPLAVWAIGGLEQALVAPLLAWGLVLTRAALADDKISLRRIFPASLCFGLLCLTRPDGPLIAAVVGLGAFLGRGFSVASLRLALGLGSMPLVLTGGQILGRLAYYSDWVPNTAHAKIAFSMVRVKQGFEYLLLGARHMPFLPIALAVVVALVVSRQRRPAALILLFPFVAWAGYVTAMGGDIFPAHRHLVPLLVIAALVVSEGLGFLAGLRFGTPVAILGALAVPALATLPQEKDEQIRRAHDERWEWEAEPIAALLRRAFWRQQPLLAADSAGCLPYFSQLPSIDMLGLNDRYLALHPPPDFGRGYLGHELGDGGYVLSRKPDLVFFCGPLGSKDPCFRSGHEMVREPEWRAHYRRVQFETPAAPTVLRATAFVRIDGRIGLERTDERIHLPPYVMSNDGKPLVRLGANDRLHALLKPGEGARFEGLVVPEGRWRFTAEASGEVILRVRPESAGAPDEGLGSVEFELPKETRVTLEALAPPDSERELLGVTGTREPEARSP
jgi:hypothetical protein